MKIDLADIVAPAHTAIVTQELQGAVVGSNAGLGALAKEARRQALLAGIPTDYANAIIDNTLSLLATIVTTDDLLDAWK